MSTHTIEFPYTRTLGPVVGPFLTGLRDGRILGARGPGRDASWSHRSSGTRPPGSR